MNLTFLIFFTLLIIGNAGLFLLHSHLPSHIHQIWRLVVLSFFHMTFSIFFFNFFISFRRWGKKRVIGFFHPNCAQAAGGEFVLWSLYDVIRSEKPSSDLVVYSLPPTKPIKKEEWQKEIATNIHKIFGLKSYLKNSPHILNISSFRLLNIKWRFFGRICEAFSSIPPAFQCLFSSFPPHIILDTSGYPFTYFIFFIGGCSVVSYTHYPFLPPDNPDSSKRNFLIRLLIPFYYTFLRFIHNLCGLCTDLVFVNSSWTKNRIDRLWPYCNIRLLYPPCPVPSKEKLNLQILNDKKSALHNCMWFVSIAQFRREKDHKLQIDAFNSCLGKLSRAGFNRPVKLRLCGADSHDPKNIQYLSDLVKYVTELKLDDKIIFAKNVSRSELDFLLDQSFGGIHTMKYEHFGISIVEMMGRGVIPIVHNSGGPKDDIVTTVSSKNETLVRLNRETAENELTSTESLKIHLSKDNLHTISMNDLIDYNIDTGIFAQEKDKNDPIELIECFSNAMYELCSLYLLSPDLYYSRQVACYVKASEFSLDAFQIQAKNDLNQCVFFKKMN